MSGKVVGWAFDQKGLKPTEKLVLVKLADNANDEGFCFPKQSSMAEKTGLSRETVNRTIKKLAQKGLLRIEHRVKDGVNLPNWYHLNLRGVVTENHKGSDGESHRTVNEPSESIDQNGQKSLLPDNIDSRDKPDSDNGESEEESFERFYAAYPRKAGRGQAERAYRGALKHVDAATLQRAVEAFAGLCEGKDSKFIKHPATWLNGKCWLDEDVKAAMGKRGGGDGGQMPWRKLMELSRQTGQWEGPGPAPGDPGCMVPLEILRECGFENP